MLRRLTDIMVSKSIIFLGNRGKHVSMVKPNNNLSYEKFVEMFSRYSNIRSNDLMIYLGDRFG